MILTALLLLLFQDWSLPRERPRENGRWLCWTYSGKGNSAVEIRESHGIEWFAENIREFDAEIDWRAKSQSDWSDISAEVTPRGNFAGQDVADVLLSQGGSAKPFGKMVLVGDHGKFRPVVWIRADTAVRFASSRIAMVSHRPVLVTDQDYFAFDEVSNLPVNLAVDTAIAAELSKILPPGQEVRKGGGFDITSLHYAQGVWQKGDPDCCPSGGKVDIQFPLRGNGLVVLKARVNH